MLPLRNHVILLTGASGGIGCELAQQLSAGGAKLVLTGTSSGKLRSLADQLPASAVVLTHAANLVEQAGRDSLLEAIRPIGLTTLINLSGVNDCQLVVSQSADTLRHLIDVNLTAPMILTQQLLPTLLTATNPVILNVGSSFGSIGYPGYAAYCASKFGLRGFSEALRRELRGDCDVLYVAPRATQTAMNKGRSHLLNRELGNTEDAPGRVAQQIMQALIQRRPQTFIGWPEKLFARVNQIAPSIIDLAVGKQLPAIRNILGSANVQALHADSSSNTLTTQTNQTTETNKPRHAQ